MTEQLDVLVRLRNLVRYKRFKTHIIPLATLEVCREAADEIERLRKLEQRFNRQTGRDAMTKLIIVLAPLVLLWPAPLHARELVPGKKICECLEHGPRGGCKRWSCRRQYQRPPLPVPRPQHS